jgi:hypothetical protein
MMVIFSVSPVQNPEYARTAVIELLGQIQARARSVPAEASKMSERDEMILAMLRDATEQILHDQDLIDGV